ncbi:MAG TPA: lysylphosphatidylglycerol synthase transmembrane domain-containing protein [Solirubrobacteraceae bacterium]|nr:lysylphosphatidylglycerol synthase transmembrane domain-containing protein [Solirubrobacteraceae bacterium]
MATFAQPPVPSIARESGASSARSALGRSGLDAPSGALRRGASGARGLRAGRIARLRTAAAVRGSSALDSLLAAAQPQGATADALAERPRWLPRIDGRKALVLGVLAVAAFAIFLTKGPGGELTAAFERAAGADWRWAALGVVFEALAFAGYATLFWHVAGRSAPGLGLRGATEISLAGAAATRVLPTAGLGGIALTLWALARRGLEPANAVRTLLTFLILVYTVFMGALAVTGIALATGLVAGDGPLALMLAPAAFGTAVIVAALALSRRGNLFGAAVRDALALVRRADPRLLGALAWWGFDLAVLVTTFQALGAPPAAGVLVLAYFTGMVGNTIPLPGLVAGGTIGALVAFGVDASVAVPAVLAYRGIALWLPAVLGSVALAGMRQSAQRAPALATA